MTQKKIKTIKLCVNCRHLKVIGEGQEIEGLEDTRYLETLCNMFGHRMRELYQFPLEEGPLILNKAGSTDCPFWEPWDLSQKVLMEPKEASKIKTDSSDK